MFEKDQEEIKKALLRYYDRRVFTACALGFCKLTEGDFSSMRFFCGETSDREGAAAVQENVYFDVASLTKALVTVPCLLVLLNRKKLHLQQPLPELLSCAVPKDKEAITLEQLIRHTSGLPPHREYFRSPVRQRIAEGSADIYQLIVSEPLLSLPGEKYCYSDLDYMLLGRIIEEKSGESIAAFWKKTVTDPLGMSHHYYMADSRFIPDTKIFVETGRCPWSGTLLRGFVHDDNCRMMGRMSGHAGLFSTLDGIIFLCNTILLNYIGQSIHPSFSQNDLRYLARRSERDKRAPGFDVPQEKGSAAGSHFSFQSIGHLGFTGTSFWIDLERRISVVLLTNRVYFGDDSEGIRKMRPDIHDRVMKTIYR